MHLNEFAVRVVAALLIKRGLRRAGTNHGIRRLAKYRAVAPGGNHDSVRGKSAHFHAAQVHGANTATDAASIEHRGEEFPVLVFFYFPFGFVTPNLLVERVEELLAGGRSRKGRGVLKSPAEPAKIEQSFGRSVERNTHAIEQINDARRR